jgi:hypothetical protein
VRHDVGYGVLFASVDGLGVEKVIRLLEKREARLGRVVSS